MIKINYLTEILDSLEEAVLIIKPDGLICWVNQFLINYTGIDKWEGVFLESLLEEEQRGDFLSGSRITLKHKVGYALSFKLTVTDFKEGETSYIVLLLQDDQKQKELENFSQKQSVLLEAFFATQRDFVSSRKLRDFSNVFEALLRAIGMISHAQSVILYEVLPEEINWLASFPKGESFDVLKPYLYLAIHSKKPLFEKLPGKESEKILVIPLKEQQQIVGCVVLLDKKQDFSSQTVVELLPAAGALAEWLVTVREEKKELQKERDLEGKEDDLKVLVKNLAKKNNELALAKDHAVEAQKLQSEFFSSMAHELRTPLNGILGITELLLSLDLGQKELKYAKTIYQSGEILLKLINDLLSISKVEAGHLSFEYLAVDLAYLMQEVIFLLHKRAIDKGVKIYFYFPPEIERIVEADPVKLREVFMNFLSNSIKFTDKGFILVGCREVKKDVTNDNVFLEVYVSDSGIGVANELQGKIFEKFKQADASIARVYGGTGLGLPICALLIEKMKGTIGLCSVLGKGSTFSFTLPYKRLNLEPLLTSEELKELQGKTVLWISSDPIESFIVKSYFEALGFSFTECKDLVAGIEKMKVLKSEKKLFDIVVMAIESESEFQEFENRMLNFSKHTKIFVYSWERIWDQCITKENKYPFGLLVRPATYGDLVDIARKMLKT